MNGMWKVLAFLALGFFFCLSRTLAAADPEYRVPPTWPLDDAQEKKRADNKWDELTKKVAPEADATAPSDKVLPFGNLSQSALESVAARLAGSAALPQAVGTRGDLEQLVLEGNTTFSTSAIRATLTWDFDVLLARHPAPPWMEFLAVIERKIVAGYFNSGFPGVRVEVRPDAMKGRLVVHVDEGPRYLAGDVKIMGARTLSLKLLAERLTKPYWSKEALESGKGDGQSKREDPVWEAGKPAYFPPRSEAGVERGFWIRSLRDFAASARRCSMRSHSQCQPEQ